MQLLSDTLKFLRKPIGLPMWIGFIILLVLILIIIALSASLGVADKKMVDLKVKHGIKDDESTTSAFSALHFGQGNVGSKWGSQLSAFLGGREPPAFHSSSNELEDHSRQTMSDDTSATDSVVSQTVFGNAGKSGMTSGRVLAGMNADDAYLSSLGGQTRVM